jgi:hypothetical protein
MKIVYLATRCFDNKKECANGDDEDRNNSACNGETTTTTTRKITTTKTTTTKSTTTPFITDCPEVVYVVGNQCDAGSIKLCGEYR